MGKITNEAEPENVSSTNPKELNKDDVSSSTNEASNSDITNNSSEASSNTAAENTDGFSNSDISMNTYGTSNNNIVDNIDETSETNNTTNTDNASDTHISDNNANENEKAVKNKKKLMKKVLLVLSITLVSLSLVAGLMIGTKPGRKLLYGFAGKYIHSRVNKEDPINYIDPDDMDSDDIDSDDNVLDLPDDQQGDQDKTNGNGASNKPDNNQGKPEEIVPVILPDPRQENEVNNYLIFGIEELLGGKNTDSILIASVNTEDNTIKLTSLLRDTYIDMPNGKPKKLNAIYAKGGAKLLVETIERCYRIHIDGYAYLNFDSFETIVNKLGGVTIELGEEEANYLNRTNYISKKKYRNVKPGVNELNGNQVLGYCRVRKVPTLGGTNDDYGRALRQRRVLQAIFNKYKQQNILKLISIMNDCLGYVTSDLSAKQIEQVLEIVIENKITTMNTNRIPVNKSFEAYDDYNGVNSPLVIDWEKNIKKLYQFIYLDTEEEAEINYKKYMGQ